MQTLWQDVRYGVRMMFKKPGVTMAAILALGLGIGATTAIFSVINAVLLRSLAFRDPNRLTMVLSFHEGRVASNASGSASYPDFVDWREQNQVFEAMAALRSRGYTLTGKGDPERIAGARVSASFFPLLGISAAQGRTFVEEEDQAAGVRVAVLTHELWQRRFGGDAGAVGQMLTLDGQPYEVVGVLPPGFKFPIEIGEAEIFSPFALDDSRDQRGNHYLHVIARLSPDATPEIAQAEMTALAARLAEQYPEDNAGRIVQVASLYEELTGDLRTPLWILFGAVGLVLLIACTNVANLLLARAASREREIAIRAALGASRGRVARQMLTESLVLALVGGGLGLLLAFWAVDALRWTAPTTIPRLEELSVDSRVLGFTLLVSLLTGLIFGSVPAWRASRPDLNVTLKDGSRGSGVGFARHRLLSSLVVSQIALALLLLVGAGLLIKSFLQLRQVNPGFTADKVLIATLSLPTAKYDSEKKISNFFAQAVERIKTLPGVEAVGGTVISPLSGNSIRTTFAIEKQPVPPDGQEPRAQLRAILPGYLQTMQIPLLRGRDISPQDTADKPGVILISETMAREFWPNQDPIGQRISIGVQVSDEESPVREIVGVFGDVRHFGLDLAPQPEMYVPHAQQAWPFMTLTIRTAGEPMSLANAVRGEVLSIDKDQPLTTLRPLSQQVSASVAQPRFYMQLLGIFSAVAFVLAIVGIYGVMSYAVSQRTHEIGIRMALGAASGDVLGLIIRQGMALAFAGIGIGLLAAFAVTRLLQTLLFEVSATDPLTFAGLSLLLAIAAFFACWIPARRAMKVSPMTALRYE